MQKEVKVSVIIPVYNAELYLQQCLDSVIDQTLIEIEIICVNDGSTDSSEEILDSYAVNDSRIQIITLPHSHGGAGFPRNIGLEAAKGKYLSFLDADDYFDIHMLENMYRMAEEKNTDVVWCDAFYYYNESGRIVPAPAFMNLSILPSDCDIFFSKDIRKKLFQFKDGQAWNGLYRHEFIKNNNLRFQEDIHIIDDLLFSYSVLLYADRMCVDSSRYIYYRVNNSNSQSANFEKYPTVFCDALEALHEIMHRNGLWDDYKNSFCNKATEFFMTCLNRMREYMPYKQLYDRLKNDSLSKLGLLECKEEVFEQIDRYNWIRTIHQYSAEEYLMQMKSQFVYQEIALIPLAKFPENVIPQNSKVILYGAGEVGKAWYTQVLFSKWCKIIAWVDHDADFLGYPLKRIEDIVGMDFDYILISVLGEGTASDIQRALVEYGIEEGKIIWTLPR